MRAREAPLSFLVPMGTGAWWASTLRAVHRGTPPLLRRWPAGQRSSARRPPSQCTRLHASDPAVTPTTGTTETPTASPPSLPARGNTLVVVGLGNPGERFANTRHNAGFLAVDLVAQAHRAGAFRLESKFRGLHTTFRSQRGQKVHLLKPVTFMNQSGQAVRALLDYTKALAGASSAPNLHVLVLVDDTALSFGELRFRPRGGAGGHNGLKSVERALGSREYARLRIGVGGGRTAGNGSSVDHVLGEFNKRERQFLQEHVLIDCLQVVDAWLAMDDLHRVMELCNSTLKQQR
ncbi:hypothetical protein CDCA_CDCA03G1132 [Cyanidium caldarium]|uniref:Peptidyl-tRNA hydrolase n=1 Tax=Cyanidium caldarium TaxID=2771 RepID=A0AAV9IRY3_CYACA|nr:hypothetical protein CDCA_CDCA03G1132 [Cyanidium caldarium]